MGGTPTAWSCHSSSYSIHSMHQSNFITHRTTLLTMQQLFRVNNLVSSFITKKHYFDAFHLRLKQVVSKNINPVLFHFICIKVLFGRTLLLYFHFNVKLNRSSIFFFLESYITARSIVFNMCCTYGITEKKTFHTDNRY